MTADHLRKTDDGQDADETHREHGAVRSMCFGTATDGITARPDGTVTISMSTPSCGKRRATNTPAQCAGDARNIPTRTEAFPGALTGFVPVLKGNTLIYHRYSPARGAALAGTRPPCLMR